MLCLYFPLPLMQSTSSTSRVVKQFHFVAWPENGAPSSGDGMIDLIDQVVRTQQQTGNKSIVVHCRSVPCVCVCVYLHHVMGWVGWVKF